ncbi:MAG TPA: polyketide cyclase / dehydrase and lipid transport [Kineosporiaceae bacterium]|nr:polyketide cyclase / dehydrase and lipid transport [Kineosporiaceae bacterium]
MELSDETFIAVDRPSVAAAMGDSRRWVEWWPDLQLEVARDRGDKGRQWILTGQIRGTAEVYLEPWHDGTIVHVFLRLEPGTTQPPTSVTDQIEAVRRRSLSWKRTIHRLKDELEAGRAAGTGAQVDHRT